MRSREPVLVSAHRCGAGDDRALENTRVPLDRALTLGVDFVEFDVRRCRDATLVLFHDDGLMVDGRRRPLSELSFEEFTACDPHFLGYDEILTALKGRARAHVDLKFVSPPSTRGAWEVAAARRAVEVLGAENLIITTVDDRAVRAVRDWSATAGLDLLVGLSLGRGVAGLPWHRQIGIRLSELRPARRYLASGATLVVANHALARLGVARFARRRGLPLLVWTVDSSRSLSYWMRPGRAWLVTTNHPGLALRVRAAHAARRTGRDD